MNEWTVLNHVENKMERQSLNIYESFFEVMKDLKHSGDSCKRMKGVSLSTIKSIFSFICVLFIISFFLLFITNHLTALLLSLNIVPPKLISLFSPPLYIYAPFRITIFPLKGVALYAYFLFLVFSIIASFIWMVKSELKDALKMLKDALKFKGNLNFNSKNSLILIPQLFILYFFCTTVYWKFLDITGIYPAWSGGYLPSWELMFIFINASVYEEIFFRLLLIGIPLFIIDFARRKNKPAFRYVFGGDFKFDFFTIFLLMISSIIFGIAHITFPRTIHEFPPMFFIGLVFSYLFLKKGIYASIILHFSIDFIDMLAISAVRRTYIDILEDVANSSLVFPDAAATFLVIPLFAICLLIIFGSVVAPFYFEFYVKKSILLASEKWARIIKGIKGFF